VLQVKRFKLLEVFQTRIKERKVYNHFCAQLQLRIRLFFNEAMGIESKEKKIGGGGGGVRGCIQFLLF